jgi:hypothetical protein
VSRSKRCLIFSAVEASDKARWVGFCRWLKVGYVASGHAWTRKIGAVATTFGVVELCGVKVGDATHEAAIGFCLGRVDAYRDCRALLTAGIRR